MRKRVLCASKVTYRGYSLAETERDGAVRIELWYGGKEFLFDTLGEATGFLDAVYSAQARVLDRAVDWAIENNATREQVSAWIESQITTV